METRTAVNAFKINIVCDECSTKPNPGCILREDKMVYDEKPKFYYSCPLCDKKYILDKFYPYTYVE